MDAAPDERTPVSDARDAAAERTWRVPVWFDRSTSWVWRSLVLFAGLYVAALLFSSLRLVLVPVFVAALITAAVHPLARKLRSSGIPRTTASIAVYLLSLVVLFGTIAGLGALIGGELQTAKWDLVAADVEDWLTDGPLGLSSQEVDELAERVTDRLAGGLLAVDMDRVQLVSSLGGATLLTLVLFFFFLKDCEEMWSWVIARIKPVRRESFDAAGRAAADALAGYMRGIAIAGIADGVSIGLVMALVGVPLAIPIGVITFFAAFLPVVGALLAGGLAVLVTLVFTGPQNALIVGAAVIAVQQFEGNVIVPFVMGRQVSLHPAAILIALGIGGAAAGIVGAFVAVPLTAVAVAAVGAVRATAVPTVESTNSA